MQLTSITKILNVGNPDNFPHSKYRNASHIKMSELRTRILLAFQRKLIYLLILSCNNLNVKTPPPYTKHFHSLFSGQFLKDKFLNMFQFQAYLFLPTRSFQ